MISIFIHPFRNGAEGRSFSHIARQVRIVLFAVRIRNSEIENLVLAESLGIGLGSWTMLVRVHSTVSTSSLRFSTFT